MVLTGTQNTIYWNLDASWLAFWFQVWNNMCFQLSVRVMQFRFISNQGYLWCSQCHGQFFENEKKRESYFWLC